LSRAVLYMLPTISNVPWQVVEGAIYCFQSVFLWGREMYKLQYVVLVKGNCLQGTLPSPTAHHKVV